MGLNLSVKHLLSLFKPHFKTKENPLVFKLALSRLTSPLSHNQLQQALQHHINIKSIDNKQCVAQIMN